MTSSDIYEYLERISSLLRTDVRRAGIALGLQPVQLEALHYLSRCNRYSNTPMAVAEFLGLTKGTVSQTLGILESNRLIEKQPDGADRRVVHLVLTELGRQVVCDSLPPGVLESAMGDLSETEGQELVAALGRILRSLQHANGLKTFGACKNCRHHLLQADGSRRCMLTTEVLTDADSEMICREHQPPDETQALNS
jgi:DNA-binding MarR family transcriptional regulator